MRKAVYFIINFLLFIGLLIIMIHKKEEIIKETKKQNYHEIVMVVKDSQMYKKENGNYLPIGEIKAGTKIYLEPIDLKNNYFQLKNTDYYIFYQTVEQTVDDIETYEKYEFFDEVIQTTSSFTLDDNMIIQEENELTILKKDENQYYVSFNHQIKSIAKKDVKEVKQLKGQEKIVDTISVLKLKQDNDIEKIIDFLSTNQYHSITLEEYQEWREEKIQLQPKTILLITEELLNTEIMSNRFSIHHTVKNEFMTTNQPSTRLEKNSYELIKFDEKILKNILSKEVIIYEKATKIPVLNYHFFYDKAVGTCNEIICLEKKKFEEQLQYLKNNGYKTLSLDEFNRWMKGEIDLPKKSVLLTIDDGAMGTSFINGNILIPLLEKYQMKATLFLITAWWDINNYRSDYLEVESHGHDIHQTGKCGDKMITCLTQKQLHEDLAKSVEIVQSKQAFCYPFYVSTDSAVKVLKEIGFESAFGGGNFKASRSSNKYYLPRYPIFSNITMNEFIRMIE